MNDSPYLTILGGGLAGLTLGYYAKQNHLSSRIFEEQNRVGGHSITFQYRDFLFDSGAHFFRDKDPTITEEIKSLMGDSLNEVRLSVQIYYKGKFIDFPLSPLNLLKNLNTFTSFKMFSELIFQRIFQSLPNDSFESFAVDTYGKTLANLFFLNHSQKLWGLPCNSLSPDISGGKLRPLDFKTFFLEVFFGKTSTMKHLDSAFYYPKRGIGMIPDRLAEYCGWGNISLNSLITRIIHNQKRIQKVEINNETKVEVQEIVNTLPLPLFLHMLKPQPPSKILQTVENLRYRDMLLIVLFINRDSVTASVSIHFPDIAYPFTRVHEPKNRSISMSPKGKTSLILELPRQQGDTLWRLPDDQIIQLVCSHLVKIGFISSHEVEKGLVQRLSYVYPILDIGYRRKIQTIFTYLNTFENLALTGRSGAFKYLSIHNIMKASKKLIHKYISH